MTENELKKMVEASAEELTEMRWKKIKEIDSKLDELKGMGKTEKAREKQEEIMKSIHEIEDMTTWITIKQH